MKPLIPFANINPEAFLYDLPESRIAMFPEIRRDMSKLLIAGPDGEIHQDLFLNISNHLPTNSTLFFNNSRVIPARLHFKKDTGSQIEIFCLQPLHPADYSVSLASVQSCVWECMIGNMKKFNTPFIEKTVIWNHLSVVLKAEMLHAINNIATIRFSWNHTDLCFAEILMLAGKIPLPPYIKREATEKDSERYQTVFSHDPGSVAAPTAGLHFTKEVLTSLDEKGIQAHSVTLHVGAGTFQPVKAKVIAEHVMHGEYFEVSKELLDSISCISGKVVCVGTTTVRTLESIYWLGVKILENKSNQPDELHLDQWDCYLMPQHYSIHQALDAIRGWLNQKGLTKKSASTQMMILPGYTFKITDILITNFHQPGSTLLLLIAAFMGDSWRKAYQFALDHEFRFLSYGDSSLLFRSDRGNQ